MYLYPMKRSHLVLLLPILAIILLGSHCKPEPPEITPCFTVVEDTFRDPREPLEFVNCSEGADSYFWQFGDGTTSTEVSPAHTFAQVGTYDVRLTASLGDAQEIFIRQINVDYPRIKKVRILQMPVINPRNGLPFDPDGSGLDLYFELEWVTDNSGKCNGRVFDVSLPIDINLSSNPSIEAYWWNARFLTLAAWNVTRDTVGTRTIPFENLMAAPVRTEHWGDSVIFEIHMEGFQ
jgi:hypothetical protein